MQLKIQVLCLLLVGAVGPTGLTAADVCGPIAGNTVQNCGFETGNFTDWTLSGNLEGGAQGNYYGVNTGFQNSGNYSAYFGVQGGGGTNIGSLGPFLDLWQSITLAGDQYYRLTFYLEDYTAPATGYQQYFAASLDGTQLNVIQNPIDPKLIGHYEEFSYLVSPMTRSGRATLSFLFQNDDSYWFLDDVSIAPASATPEPASALLVAPLLAALYLGSRRRRN